MNAETQRDAEETQSLNGRGRNVVMILQGDCIEVDPMPFGKHKGKPLTGAPGIGSTDLLCVRCDFIEEYYGWRCSNSGRFYPNTAPLENWLLNEPYENPD